MQTTWNKTTLTLMMTDAADEKVRFSYNNIVRTPSDEQIKKFADVVALLTGTTFVSASVATTEDKNDVAA